MTTRRNDCAVRDGDETDSRIAYRIKRRHSPALCAVNRGDRDGLARVVVQLDVLVACAVNILRRAEGRAAEAELANQHIARVDRIGDRAHALPICDRRIGARITEIDEEGLRALRDAVAVDGDADGVRDLAGHEGQGSEEHTSELQSL